MNYFELYCLVLSLITFEAYGYPQDLRHVAQAVKETEHNYYHSDAPDLIPFDNPNHKDNAKEEVEGYGSRIYSTYDGLHKKTSDVFKPKGVVDTIKSDSEKFGNTGDQLKPLSDAVVSAMSVVSNVVNALVDAPGNLFAYLSRSLNTGLNSIGGKLVGLQ
ncbi:uncharacterized protein [Chironomus tepperi]|uniref:uncharacterized protein n=1 Tax=Chironomus tepperi TaxID=113505 RepID=UPI00391FCA54